MKVLILGVGNAQVDAIVRCKESGYEVVGISYKREGNGLELVDHFEQIDTTDKEKVLIFAGENNFDFLYSVGSDVAMPTVGYVSEKLNIPFFIDAYTSALLQDKGASRDFLTKHHIVAPRWRIIDSKDDLEYFIHYPAIIKPVDSQGQRGVYKVNNLLEAENYYNNSLSFSKKKQVIIEEYIDGTEISVNAFVVNGEVVYHFISDRYVLEGYPGGIPKGHSLPALVSKEIEEQTISLVKACVSKLNIKNGPLYFQLKYTNDKLFVIEIASRLDGCHLCRMIRFKYGIDLLDLSFKMLGNNLRIDDKLLPSVVEKKSKRIFIRFFRQKPSAIFKIQPLVREGYLYHCWYYKSGEVVRPLNCHMERTGYQIWEE